MPKTPEFSNTPVIFGVVIFLLIVLFFYRRFKKPTKDIHNKLLLSFLI